MGESNSMSLRNQTEEISVTIKAPRPPVLNDLKARFIVTVEKCLIDAAARVFIRQFYCVGAKPLYADDRCERIRKDTAYS